MAMPRAREGCAFQKHDPHSLIRSCSAVDQANASPAARVAELTEAQANAALERLARQDGLTGLPNRRMADARLVAELSRHHRSGQPMPLLVHKVGGSP